MKKLNKRSNFMGNTIQAYACYCSCSCGCGCSCNCGIFFWTHNNTSNSVYSSAEQAGFSGLDDQNGIANMLYD